MRLYPQLFRIDASKVAPENKVNYINAETCRFINTLTLANERLLPRLVRVGEDAYEVTYYTQISYDLPAGTNLRGATSMGQGDAESSKQYLTKEDTTSTKANSGPEKVLKGGGSSART